MSRAFEALGWEARPFDVLIGGGAHDLANTEVVDQLCEEIRTDPPDAATLAPPCCTFSCFMRLRLVHALTLGPVGRQSASQRIS